VLRENENRLGLTGQTSPCQTQPSVVPEWPAAPAATKTITDSDGKEVEIPFTEWLAKIGNNNRGGT